MERVPEISGVPEISCVYYAVIKVGHLYCRICVGIVVSNNCRILCSKVTNKVSEFRDSKFESR